MDPSNATHELLQALLDTQREHLAEYQRVTQRSLELQERAVRRQEQLGRLYARVVAVGGGLVAVILALVFYLLNRYV